jgi:hypothetical protein
LAASSATLTDVAVVLPFRGLHETPTILTFPACPAVASVGASETAVPEYNAFLTNFLRFIIFFLSSLINS